MWAPGENLPATNYIFIKHKEIIPGSLESVNYLAKNHYEKLVLGLPTLFDTGTWVWLWILYLFVCIMKRAWK